MSGGKAIRAGKAFVELGADESSLKKGLDSAQKKLSSFGKQLRSIGTTVAGAGAAITAPIGLAVAGFAKAGDQLNKMALRTGTSVEALSELGFAAEQSGSDLESVGKALAKMGRNVADAARGAGPAVSALEELGINAADLATMTPDKQLEAIASGMAGLGDTGYAAQLAFEIFGRSAEDLAPLLANGGDGIAALREQARELGITMSTEDAAGAAAFTDSMNILQRSLTKVYQVVAAAVVPALNQFIEYLTPMVTAAIEWASQNKPLIMTIAGIGAALLAAGTAIVGMGVAISGIGAVIGFASSIIGALSAALAIVPLQVIAVAAALTAGLVAFVQYTSVGQSMLSWFSTEFGKLTTIAGNTMRGVFDAIKAGRLELAMEIALTGLKLAVATAMEAVLGIFGASIQDMMTMIAQVFGAINKLINRLNVARVEVVNWLSGSIGDALNWATGTNNFDTSIEQEAARKQAQAGMDAALKFDPKAAGANLAKSFNTDDLQEKLANLNKTASEAAEAIDTADTAIKLFEFDLEGIEEGAGNAKNQMGTAALGTFSGALAGQVTGQVSFQNKQLDLSKKIERNTRGAAGSPSLTVTP